jgi:hypothetical protein
MSRSWWPSPAVPSMRASIFSGIARSRVKAMKKSPDSPLRE